MNDIAQEPKHRVPRWAFVVAGAVVLLILLAKCGSEGSGSIDLASATCESLIPHVIDMSKGKDPEILEITDPREGRGSHGMAQQISCDADAEWSRGEGTITYGAYESDGGHVMLEYKQD